MERPIPANTAELARTAPVGYTPRAAGADERRQPPSNAAALATPLLAEQPPVEATPPERDATQQPQARTPSPSSPTDDRKSSPPKEVAVGSPTEPTATVPAEKHKPRPTPISVNNSECQLVDCRERIDSGEFEHVKPPEPQCDNVSPRITVIADTLHNVFLGISVPLAVIAGVLAIALYATDEVAAVTVSHCLAGYCAFAATVLTAFLIFLHTTVYTNPRQQRLICRILLMVPIYSFDSWVALMAYKSATVIGLVRDSYEAYVIYMFFRLLMEYLGSEEQAVALWAAEMPTMPHMFPLNHCMKPLALTAGTLTWWKRLLVQYMVLNPLLTIISIPFYYTGHYEEGALEPGNVYLYTAAIRFVSVTLAFTSLVYFFMAVRRFIPEQRPLWKFAAIKTIVFLTFWQSVLLGGLNHFHLIPHSQLWTSDQVATGLNNFVICLEMFLISIAHRWCFPDTPYRPLDGRRPLQCWVIGHLLSVKDVVDEAHEALLTPIISTTKRAVYSATSSTPVESL